MTRKTAQPKTPIEQKNCCEEMEFPDHSPLLSNLNRISGQIEGIKKMISQRRYCVEILQQFKAVKSALGGVETQMLEDHMDSCLVKVFNSENEREKSEKIDELKKLYRDK